VTGSTAGMGRSTALTLASNGAAVIINGRDHSRGESIVKEIISSGGRAVFIPGDITERSVNESLVRAATEFFGRLDIVVCNAGELGLGRIADLTDEQWHHTFAVNVHSVFYLLRSAIPVMLKSEHGAICINASIAAFKSFPGHPAYCASKAAVVALAKQIALDYGPAIRCNVVCPGPVDTQFIHDSAIAFADPAAAVEEAGQRTAMKRLGVPDDVAELVLFLVSQRSSWMTGSVLTIDGGATLS
jgi:NAD(P)-dependent dehydrogenase (short-subunit alcohol dehydrogenase family)